MPKIGVYSSKEYGFKFEVHIKTKRSGNWDKYFQCVFLEAYRGSALTGLSDHELTDIKSIVEFPTGSPDHKSINAMIEETEARIKNYLDSRGEAITLLTVEVDERFRGVELEINTEAATLTDNSISLKRYGWGDLSRFKKDNIFRYLMGADDNAAFEEVRDKLRVQLNNFDEIQLKARAKFLEKQKEELLSQPYIKTFENDTD